MQNCELTREELDVLIEIVQHAATELDIEIRRTDTQAFKEQLKHRRALLDNIQARLTFMPVMA